MVTSAILEWTRWWPHCKHKIKGENYEPSYASSRIIITRILPFLCWIMTVNLISILTFAIAWRFPLSFLRLPHSVKFRPTWPCPTRTDFVRTNQRLCPQNCFQPSINCAWRHIKQGSCEEIVAETALWVWGGMRVVFVVNWNPLWFSTSAWIFLKSSRWQLRYNVKIDRSLILKSPIFSSIFSPVTP